ncbi:HIRAN domain-containing protein [Hydrogenovibrio halophilus]|uniref:HIRAN domain-containing protein n=1 Tax=Hydrogenovibrio halophilus TaxID=373391 RepID=UPI00036C325E|nr:HIRAN domain-containing protein [Hydrogenovibrio halophilus]
MMPGTGSNIRCETLRVKGTRYYQAQLAWEAGLLAPFAPLVLVREPDNRYDHHAIQIWLLRPRMLLGYVPRTLAPRIGWQMKNGHLRQTHLSQTPVRGLTQPGLRWEICARQTWLTPWVRLRWQSYQAWLTLLRRFKFTQTLKTRDTL